MPTHVTYKEIMKAGNLGGLGALISSRLGLRLNLDMLFVGYIQLLGRALRPTTRGLGRRSHGGDLCFMRTAGTARRFVVGFQCFQVP